MAKLRIQGASANHPMNRKPASSPDKLPIQGSSANYMGKSVSTSKTPSPASRPYPAQTNQKPKTTAATSRGKY